jgi:adenosine deaminase
MPKAELHLHLDGSLRIETALELARTRAVDAPDTYDEMRAALVPSAQAGSQADLLRAFELPIQLMQDREALERIAFELVETKAADAVRYVEIRWAPGWHVRRGLSLADGIAAVCSGAAEGARRTGTLVRLICVALRSQDPAVNVEVAETAARFRDRGVAGFDLAGLEAEYPDPLVHREAFAVARAEGLRITVHAGELPHGAPAVRRALELEPDRIAHGAGAIEDADLCNELAARGVTLDLCPTSNWQSSLVATLARHPAASLYRRGVPITISTDNATISDLALSDEYVNAVEALGLTLAELWHVNLHALEAAFAERGSLDDLQAEFERFAGHVPELAQRIGPAEAPTA